MTKILVALLAFAWLAYHAQVEDGDEFNVQPRANWSYEVSVDVLQLGEQRTSWSYDFEVTPVQLKYAVLVRDNDGCISATKRAGKPMSLYECGLWAEKQGLEVLWSRPELDKPAKIIAPMLHPGDTLLYFAYTMPPKGEEQGYWQLKRGK